MADTDVKFDAWHPGLNSELPRALLPKVTLYRPENSDTCYGDAKEAADFCGLKPQDLSALKASRLVMHEVLIRVTSDLYVSDGPSYEELGLNLRSMAGRILDTHIRPRMPEIEAVLAEVRTKVETALAARLDADIYMRPAATIGDDKPSLFARLFKTRIPEPVAADPPEFLALSEWQDALGGPNDPFELACLKGLHAVVSGIVGQRGRLMADKALVVRLASILVCNSYGSRRIGEWIKPLFLKGAAAESYRLLPYQAAPFVMNVKGASGAGKSTIRPLQRELAERLGIRWEDFALVSPDYWRKFLLDYQSIGEDFKYAAMLTGQELEIIDKKLDVYMEEKASRAEMPHLLIDRFRFDSFVSSSSQQADGRLLSRFGHTVFMFFIITPPTETVERAWKRGLETGRYKAVDDLLYHNIEAYTGMPQLFLSWVNKTPQKVHFEFLDNDVPYGHRPKSAAFGWNGEITILDADCIRRLSHFRRVNVDATRPEDVYLPPSGQEEDILVKFIEKIPNVTFINPETLALHARIKDGVCLEADDSFLAKTGLAGLIRKSTDSKPSKTKAGILAEKKFTVGTWGDD